MKMKTKIKINKRYLPKRLTKKDRGVQARMLLKSRKMYKTHKYYTRKSVESYKHKTSNHILDAQKMYKVKKIIPSEELSKATGCSIDALNKIVNKACCIFFNKNGINAFKMNGLA